MRTFKKLYLEITNLCNRQCTFCPPDLRPGTYLPASRFEILIKKLLGRGKHLYFHVRGEPLVHPDLGGLLDIARTNGFMVNITTNGFLLNEKSNVLLTSPALRQINISLHSCEDLKELPGYLEDLTKFLMKSQVGGPIINLRLWDQIQNQESELEKHILIWLKNLFPEGLPKGVFLDYAKRFQWPDLSNKDLGRNGFCYGLRDQLAVLVDGTVVPCCLDGEGVISLGNIFDQDLEEILQSPRALKLYNGFSQRKVIEPLCRGCGFKTRFDE